MAHLGLVTTSDLSPLSGGKADIRQTSPNEFDFTSGIGRVAAAQQSPAYPWRGTVTAPVLSDSTIVARREEQLNYWAHPSDRRSCRTQG
jgi:hypothetical protein